MTTATKLKEVLDSPRAVSAMSKAGIVTVEDLSGISLEDLAKINGVGQRTLEQIQTLRAPTEAEPDFGEMEESNADIHLASPRQKYVIWVLRGDKIHDPTSGANRVVPPILIEFRKGRGTISREKFLNRLYLRNPEKIRDHMIANKPWRVECANWLKGRQKHGVEYTLLTD